MSSLANETQYLEEVKARLHILHNHDDENLIRLIKMGHEVVQGYTGNFPLSYDRGRDLVYEYVRFAYNNMTEWFYESFMARLLNLNVELTEVEDGETTSGESKTSSDSAEL